MTHTAVDQLTTTVLPAAPETGVLHDLREIVSNVRQYHELLFELTRRDIRIRYKQALMGFGWAIFMPILVVLSGVLVRFAMSQVSGGGLHSNEVAGIAIKGVAWSFFVGTITFATTSLTSNANLVSKVYFPREVLPLSTLLAQMFDTGIGACALLLFLPFLGVGFSLQLLWVPVIAVILIMLTAGATLFLSCANLFFRDVKYIVQVLLTFGIFFTPVFFEVAMLGPKGAKLAMFNPLAPLLEGLRLATVQHHNLLTPLVETNAHGLLVTAWSPWNLAYSVVWGVLGLFASALLFHRAQAGFAENV